jgi:hypothetical protein
MSPQGERTPHRWCGSSRICSGGKANPCEPSDLEQITRHRRIGRELHGVLKLREQEGESPERSWLIGISTLGISEFSRSRRSGHFKFRNSERKSEPSV